MLSNIIGAADLFTLKQNHDYTLVVGVFMNFEGGTGRSQIATDKNDVTKFGSFCPYSPLDMLFHRRTDANQ